MVKEATGDAARAAPMPQRFTAFPARQGGGKGGSGRVRLTHRASGSVPSICKPVRSKVECQFTVLIAEVCMHPSIWTDSQRFAPIRAGFGALRQTHSMLVNPTWPARGEGGLVAFEWQKRLAPACEASHQGLRSGGAAASLAPWTAFGAVGAVGVCVGWQRATAQHTSAKCSAVFFPSGTCHQQKPADETP